MKTALFLRAIPAVTCLLLAISLGGCDRLSSGQGEKEMVDTYIAFRTALSAGDLQKAASFLAAARAGELASDPAAADKVRLAAYLLPGTMTVMGVAAKDGKGTLTLRDGAMVTLAGGSSAPAIAPLPAFASAGGNGTVTFVKEGGNWKVDRESWQQDLGSSLFAAPATTPFFREGGTLPRLLRSMAGAGSPMRGGEGVAPTPDGFSIIAIGDNSIVRFSSTDGRETGSASMEHRPTAVVVTPDAGSAITLDTYGGITFWPLTVDGFGTPQRSGNVGQSSSLAVNRDGRYLATASFDKVVTIWDIPTRKEIARVAMPEPMRSVAFSPSGQLLAAGSAQNSFTLWDLESGKGRTYKIPKVDTKSDVSGIAFSPDGKRLATSHMDSSITLWDAVTQQEIRNFFVSQSSSWTVRFSPDGGLFATATQGGGIHLWNSENGNKLGVLQGQSSQPLGLAFSPDGRYLYSLGEKGEVAVWGAE